MPDTKADQTKPINPPAVDGATTLNADLDPVESTDFRINLESDFAARELRESHRTFALCALAASSGNMHLQPEAIAKHAWNVAGAMITEGQARGLVPQFVDTEAADAR